MQVNPEKVVFGEDFGAFMDYLSAPGASTTISAERYAQVLGMDLQTLAESVGSHGETATCAPVAAKLQQFLRESVRALSATMDRSGSVEHALYWFSKVPLQAFGYKTAYTLVSEGRTEALLSYLASLDAGFAG